MLTTARMHSPKPLFQANGSAEGAERRRIARNPRREVYPVEARGNRRQNESMKQIGTRRLKFIVNLQIFIATLTESSHYGPASS
jgi:hypothetical protein